MMRAAGQSFHAQGCANCGGICKLKDYLFAWTLLLFLIGWDVLFSPNMVLGNTSCASFWVELCQSVHFLNMVLGTDLPRFLVYPMLEPYIILSTH